MINTNLNKAFILGLALSTSLLACQSNNNNTASQGETKTTDTLQDYVDQRLAIYEKVKLTTNLNQLTTSERKVLPLLIEAAAIMDDLYWQQVYPQRDSLLNTVKNEKTIEFIRINYGPWDRLNGDKPFVAGIGPKPDGGTFYPLNMTKEALEKSDVKDKFGLYSVIRTEKDKLISVPYHVIFAAELQRASSLLKQAALLTDDTSFKKYLNLRADALVSDNYKASDLAWLDMKTNGLDIIIGPIENYEDKLFNARASYEAYVLVKDKEWSKRLAKYVAMLPKKKKKKKKKKKVLCVD
eukprot:Opistho-1_new@25478